MSCSVESTEPPAAGVVTQAVSCDPTPYVTGIGLTDLNGNPVSSIAANTSYRIQVCGKVASVCLTLASGGQLASGSNTSCHDLVFPTPYTEGDIGTTFYTVQPAGAGVSLTGQVTPWDACSGEQPQATTPFTLPGGTGCAGAPRNYVCGYARPGHNCNNWRISSLVVASSMTTAIAACPQVQPSLYTDFCYVIAKDGAIPTDSPQCAAAGGSWRPAKSCCNFKGTLSCPP